MEVVGDYLINAVSEVLGEVDKDLFGRSAFNRYYYAAFLAVRQVFSEIDEKLNEPQHGRIPDLLTETLNNRVKRVIKRQEKAGVISPAEAQELRDTLGVALQSLADLMRYAYSIRKIADYMPDTKIELKGSIVGIGGCESTVARGWRAEVEVKVDQIRDIWRRLGN